MELMRLLRGGIGEGRGKRNEEFGGGEWSGILRDG